MKKGIIIGVAVLVVAGAVFFLWRGGKKVTAPVDEGQEAARSAENSSGGNVLLDTADKIKNAMLGGQKMECVFKETGDDSVPVDMVMQSQGEKFRTVSKIQGETMISVSDGKTMYNWSEKTKKGTKYEFKCLDELNEDSTDETDNPAIEAPDFETPTEIADSVPDMNCRPIASIDFSIPKDVVFEDGCAALKQMKEMLKQYDLPQ